MAELIAGSAGIDPGARVIDLCCGPGLLASRLAERVGPGGEVIGVDSSPAMISLCKRTVHGTNARFVEGDAYSLWSLLRQPVDHVVATSAWQNFLLDKEQLAEQLYLTLPASGRFSFDVRLSGTDSAADDPSLQETARGLLLRLARERWGLDLKAGLQARKRGRWRRYDAERLNADLAVLAQQAFTSLCATSLRSP